MGDCWAGAALDGLQVSTRSDEHNHSYWKTPCVFCGILRARNDKPEPEVDFAPWPRGLRSLDLTATNWPLALFRSSADTLTSIKLTVDLKPQLGRLRSLIPHLGQLRSLTVPSISVVSADPFSLPPEFVAFVAALPRLAALTLHTISAQQLEQLLAHRGRLPPLRTLATEVITILEHNADHEDDYAKWVNGLVPTLRRCGAMMAERGVGRWRLGIKLMEYEEDCDMYDFPLTEEEEFEDWGEMTEGWEQFEAEVEGQGVELVLERV